MMREGLSRFVQSNFVLLAGLGVVGLLLSLNFWGTPLPVRPASSALTPQVIASAVVSAFEAKDARAPEPPYPEFLRLPNMPEVQLLSSFLSFVAINDEAGKSIHRLKGVFVINGEIKQAYVRVHVARPLHDWEDVYVTINEKGGSLRATESLRVPPDSRSTTLLYDTRNVPHGTKEVPSDWFAMLKPRNRIVVDGFLNAEQASLLDISLFYECAEPGTCGVTKM